MRPRWAIARDDLPAVQEDLKVVEARVVRRAIARQKVGVRVTETVRRVRRKIVLNVKAIVRNVRQSKSNTCH